MVRGDTARMNATTPESLPLGQLGRVRQKCITVLILAALVAGLAGPATFADDARADEPVACDETCISVSYDIAMVAVAILAAAGFFSVGPEVAVILAVVGAVLSYGAAVGWLPDFGDTPSTGGGGSW